MSNSEKGQTGMKAALEKIGPGVEKAGEVCGKIGHVFSVIWLWLFRLRKLFLAIPVAYFCWRLASYNNENLPDEVGLNLLADGTFERMVPKDIAVLGPVAVTALCLLLMMCSRKTIYPWLISIFTLAIPVLLALTNIYLG